MNNVRCLRLAANLSQAALAADVGVSQQAVGKWELGKSDPDWDMAPKLAKALSCPIEDLFVSQPRDCNNDNIFEGA